MTQSPNRRISTRRILVCNDDGINAPGIGYLEKIARDLSDDVWVVAPETEQSGAGHSLTLTRPIRIRKLDEKRWAVSGTPTDCVMMAANHIMRDDRPTLLLSGINRGANMAEDVTYSGTIAAAMEGTLAGIPSIALSQAIRPGQRTRWHTADRYARQIIEDLVATGWPQDVLVNVNFPAYAPQDVRGINITSQGQRDLGHLDIEERHDPRGFAYYWFGLARDLGEPGEETDLHSVRNGYISITPLHLNLTHFQTCHVMDKLERTFENGGGTPEAPSQEG